ncbi:MAG: NAD-dependent malic enzyme [Cocleimonas sp.]|nr:NAD-dependent malic enzyme [Cocleimonas sp.]
MTTTNKALSPFFDLKTDKNKQKYLDVYSRGIEILRLTALNKGTAFTEKERIELGFEGLLPPVVVTLDDQVTRLYTGFTDQTSDIAKYQFLRAVQERNEVLFYALISKYLEEMMPIIYTPTVGKAVQQYSSLYRSPRGLTFTADNIERADAIVNNYPWNDVRMIVATDSSAILGIGDQGHGGLAISIGKLALYTAGGGLSPFNTLAVDLDVGTDREDLRSDPGYLGVREKRLTGDAYFKVLDQFVDAVQKRWPKAIIQWEDFAKDIAFTVLERYKDKLPSFNDDIQGTGAVVLAGLLSACKIKGEALADQKIVVVGAGAGGVGVAKVIQDGLVRKGLTREQARKQMFIMDEFGLVVEGISPDEYKKPIMQFSDTYKSWEIDGKIPSLMEVIQQAKPTILLGLTGVSGLFTQDVIEAMAQNNDTPIIFPLSNPTSNVEAIPEDIYQWCANAGTGDAIVASGSPFSDVVSNGKTYTIGQGNNAFIFPGLGFASVLGECSKITDSMIIESAYALADYTAEHYLQDHSQNHLQDKKIYPPIADLQAVSMFITKRVLDLMIEEGIATKKDIQQSDINALIRENSWKAEYLPFVAA